MLLLLFSLVLISSSAAQVSGTVGTDPGEKSWRIVMKSLFTVVLSIMLLASLFLVVQEAQAIPSYARNYKTSYSTCHYAYPKLNRFGKAFKNNGYRHPAVQYLEILFSGTFGDKISYIVEVEFEHENIPTQTLMMT